MSHGLITIWLIFRPLVFGLGLLSDGDPTLDIHTSGLDTSQMVIASAL